MADQYTLTGTLKLISDMQEFARGFTKREFVVTTNDQYPQDVKFEVVKDRCGLLDQFEIGQPVSVAFNILGNEYNSKYYVNLQAWRITFFTAEAAQAVPSAYNQGGSELDAQPEAKEQEEDDLPF